MKKLITFVNLFRFPLLFEMRLKCSTGLVWMHCSMTQSTRDFTQEVETALFGYGNVNSPSIVTLYRWSITLIGSTILSSVVAAHSVSKTKCSSGQSYILVLPSHHTQNIQHPKVKTVLQQRSILYRYSSFYSDILFLWNQISTNPSLIMILLSMDCLDTRLRILTLDMAFTNFYTCRQFLGVCAAGVVGSLI